MKPTQVLILPGWQNSGPAHWQSRWEALYGDLRVEQHDWMQPLRGDWIARLEDVLLAQNGPCWLVAHSLGCHLAAAWAALSRNTDRVTGALLVAPPDLETPGNAMIFPSWQPVIKARLPFKSIMLGCRDDPFCSLESSRLLAAYWGAEFMDYGARGHINAESGLGDWPEGRALLQTLALRQG